MTEKINFGKRTIEALPIPKEGRARYKDTGNRFLYLDVFSTGRKTFLYVRWFSGKTIFMKLGNYPEMTPPLARDAADKQSGKLSTGKTPQEIKTELKRGGNTFAGLFHEYLEKHLKVKTRLWKDDVRMFETYLKPLHNKNIKQIFPEDVRKLHLKLTADNGPYMANRTIRLVRAAFNFAIAEGQYIPNPAAKLRNVLNKEPSRKRYLSDGIELQNFFKALNTLEPFWQDFFRLALFTGARKSNIQAMKREDIDLDRKVWTISADESKNEESMEVILTDPAIEILSRRIKKGKSKYIFPSHGSTGHVTEPKGAWKRLLKAAKIKDLRIHDLRRTFGSWQARNNTSLLVIGKSLGHISTGATRIYSRLDLEPVRESVNKAMASMLEAAKGKEDKNETL